MYRDLNRVYAGGYRYLGSPRVGEVASAVPSTGDHGPALAYANVTTNGWTSQRVLFWVRSHTLSTLFVGDDSSWTGTVAADGTYTIVGDIYLDDVLQSPQATITVALGSTTPSYAAAMAALAAGTSFVGGSATYTAPAQPEYAATMAALVAGSAYAAGAAVYAAPYVETAVEPVTVAEAKLAARVDGAELDAVIAGYISTARQLAEHETGREYVAKTKRYTFTDWPSASHVMHVYQPTAVAVQHWDGAAWVTLTSGSGFAWGEVDQGVGIAPPLGQAWPALGAIAIGPRVRVDVTAGSATPTTTTPECVKTFIKAAVAFWVDNPSEGATGSLSEAPRLGRLLDPERIWGA